MKERKKLFSHLWDLPYGRTTPYHLFDASKSKILFIYLFLMSESYLKVRLK